MDVRLRRSDRDDPATNEDALAELRITVMDPDEDKVGRAFSNTVIEMVLANYPGLFTTSPPGDASSYGVYWPALVPDDLPRARGGGGRRTHHRASRPPRAAADRAPRATPERRATDARPPPRSGRRCSTTWPAPIRPAGERVPMGRAAWRGSRSGLGARSGDKGGNANIGVWARSDDAYVWLQLVPHRRSAPPAACRPRPTASTCDRYELPNLRALNFVIVGLLGRGVAASTRTDPQAKGLGEYLRAKVVEIPPPAVPRGAATAPAGRRRRQPGDDQPPTA